MFQDYIGELDDAYGSIKRAGDPVAETPLTPPDDR